MAMTYLALAQTVCGELGLSRPQTIAAAQDAQAQQIGALLNRCGDMLYRAKDGGWSFLVGEWTLSLTTPLYASGNVAVGSRVVTNLTSTTGLIAGAFVCSATYFVQQPRVVSVDSATQVTLDTAATAPATGLNFTFMRDTYSVPNDFGAFVDGTAWDRTRRWQMVGPMTKAEDQALRSGIVAPVPRRRWTQIGRGLNTFRIWPAPTASDTPATLIFDYVSKGWATSAGGVPQTSLQADTDTCVFPDDLMVIGAKWLMLQAKGFAYEDHRAMWNAMLSEAMATDGGAPDLSLSRRKIWDPAEPGLVALTTGDPGFFLDTGTLS